jgi:hypothetical protein
MDKMESLSNGPSLTTTAPAVPAPIRLVQAFRDAVEASRPEVDLSEEALSVEALVIAGLASFDALTRLDELFRAIRREGESINPFDCREVEFANETWLETAAALRGRMDHLEKTCYESESFAAFSTALRKSSEIASESRVRELEGHQALRTVELAALAARLKPRQNVYDEEEG